MNRHYPLRLDWRSDWVISWQVHPFGVTELLPPGGPVSLNEEIQVVLAFFRIGLFPCYIYFTRTTKYHTK